MTRRVFYSFDYETDNDRAAMVRNMGAVVGEPFTIDNSWEKIDEYQHNPKKRNQRIRNWISDEMNNRTCAVVLVGEHTHSSEWVRYEICKAWKSCMGVVGIHIYGLKNLDSEFGCKGKNPFDIDCSVNGNLEDLIKCYDPACCVKDISDHYDWIYNNLVGIIDNAIEDRKKY